MPGGHIELPHPCRVDFSTHGVAERSNSRGRGILWQGAPATTDYHANSVLRGDAPLLHLAAFHEAFGIKTGDPMWRAPMDHVVIR